MRGLEPVDTDWLCLGLPMAALARTDRRAGGFPFGADGGETSLTWRKGLDDWLLAIGRTVADEVPVRPAAVGFEPIHDEVAAALQSSDHPASRPWSLFLPGGDPELLPATY